MKKIIGFVLFVSLNAVGQSVTIVPSPSLGARNIVTSPTNSFGLEHTDGTVRVNTYVSNSGVDFGGWLQTASAHPLILSTANGSPQLYLNANGNTILNPSDGKIGNVGIGLTKTATPAAKLEINGDVRVASLAGTSNRYVTVNALGTLSYIPPVAFAVKGLEADAAAIGITVPHSVNTTVPFKNEEYDLSIGFYDNTTYEYSAPTAGIYHFDAMITWALVTSTFSTGTFTLELSVNGSVSSIVSMPIKENNSKTSMNLSSDVKLNAGQKVKVIATQTSGSDQKLLKYDTNCRFSGHLVMPL